MPIWHFNSFDDVITSRNEDFVGFQADFVQNLFNGLIFIFLLLRQLRNCQMSDSKASLWQLGDAWMIKAVLIACLQISIEVLSMNCKAQSYNSALSKVPMSRAHP